jgi:riboflavin-specific deaminase-like protein
MRTSRRFPFVAVNFAMTWDGKVSTRNLTPADFSSKHDKRHLLEIRATGDALLVGASTLAKDNMSMGLPDAGLRAARAKRGQAPWPLRVIASNSGRIDPNLKVFGKDFSPIVIYSTTRMPPRTRDALAGKAALQLHEGSAVDLKKMLLHLRSHYRVKCLICEGGPSLFRSLLAAGLVDEINLTLCPLVFGGSGAPTLTGLPRGFLPRTVTCRLTRMEVSGDECLLRYRVWR